MQIYFKINLKYMFNLLISELLKSIFKFIINDIDKSWIIGLRI